MCHVTHFIDKYVSRDHFHSQTCATSLISFIDLCDMVYIVSGCVLTYPAYSKCDFRVNDNCAKTRAACFLHTAKCSSALQHCDILQHTSTHCNTLQHTVTLQHIESMSEFASSTIAIGRLLAGTTTAISTLHHTTPRCSTLQHTTTHCTTLQQ